MWVEEMCEKCIFSILDIDEQRKCILHWIVVGDDDVCNKFEPRFEIDKFVEEVIKIRAKDF